MHHANPIMATSDRIMATSDEMLALVPTRFPGIIATSDKIKIKIDCKVLQQKRFLWSDWLHTVFKREAQPIASSFIF